MFFRFQLLLKCDWVECNYETLESCEFFDHVEIHVPHSESREANGKVSKWECCMWELCEFSSQSSRTAQFHIQYHAFHTRIKALGSSLFVQNPNLDCHLDFNNRNILPVLPDERICDWRDCDYTSDNFQRFLDHCNTHVTGQPHRYNHEVVYCAWQGCKKSNRNMTHLKQHLRIHTQEKVIACPRCGTQFASKTKLIDHCARQLPPEQKLCRCSYCKKSFPSERILQDHIRLHVNLHKCPLCDMTCPYRYTLALHMRYRHLSSKPFKCSFCDNCYTTERDLKTHYQTHCSENGWVCDQPGCDFSCRSQNGLASHYNKVHLDVVDEYGCHICDARYQRGAALTVHLKNKHNYRWASGQSRFRYIKDDSGIYRLQMVRYESIDVTEQIVANATQRKPNRLKKFSCAVTAPDKLVITQVTDKSGAEGDREEDGDPSSEEEDEDEVDDPDDFIEDRSEDVMKSPNEDIEVASPKIIQTLETDSESDFGECLKKHLGLKDGFIQVLKS